LASYGDVFIIVFGLTIGLSYGILSPKISFIKKNPRIEQTILGLISIVTGTLLLLWYFNDF